MRIGAHMLELRRTTAGIFFEDDEKYPSVNLYDFEKAVSEYKNGDDKNLRKIIIPGEVITKIYPTIEIKKQAVQKILHGAPIHDDEVSKKEYLKFDKGQRVVVFSEDSFIGIFKIVNEGKIFARSEFTFQPL